MFRNLLGARGMPGVVAHGWAALLALLVVLASALSLAATWLGLPAPSRDAVLAVHAVWAPYGFMGMLVLGLSYILVPMFALADRPGEREQLASWGTGVGSAGAGRLRRCSRRRRSPCASSPCWPAVRRRRCTCG